MEHVVTDRSEQDALEKARTVGADHYQIERAGGRGGAYLGARIAGHDSSVGFHVQRALCGSKILGGFVLKGVGGLVGQRRIDRNGRAGYTAGCDRR